MYIPRRHATRSLHAYVRVRAYIKFSFAALNRQIRARGYWKKVPEKNRFVGGVVACPLLSEMQTRLGLARALDVNFF